MGMLRAAFTARPNLSNPTSKLSITKSAPTKQLIMVVVLIESENSMRDFRRNDVRWRIFVIRQVTKGTTKIVDASIHPKIKMGNLSAYKSHPNAQINNNVTTYV
ncbi:hypothetical protein D3C86_1813840 [compost metagenome]